MWMIELFQGWKPYHMEKYEWDEFWSQFCIYLHFLITIAYVMDLFYMYRWVKNNQNAHIDKAQKQYDDEVKKEDIISESIVLALFHALMTIVTLKCDHNLHQSQQNIQETYSTFLSWFSLQFFIMLMTYALIKYYESHHFQTHEHFTLSKVILSFIFVFNKDLIGGLWLCLAFVKTRYHKWKNGNKVEILYQLYGIFWAIILLYLHNDGQFGALVIVIILMSVVICKRQEY